MNWKQNSFFFWGGASGFVFLFHKQCPHTHTHTEGFLRLELRPVLDQGAPSMVRCFPCKFSHKVSFSGCPCKFRLRKLYWPAAFYP